MSDAQLHVEPAIVSPAPGGAAVALACFVLLTGGIAAGPVLSAAAEETAPAGAVAPASEAVKIEKVPPQLSLAQAVRLTVNNNPQLKQARVSYLAAQSELLTASDLLDTTVRGGLDQAAVGGGRSQIGATVAAQFQLERPAGDQLSATVAPFSSSELTSSLQLQYLRPLIGRTGKTSVRGVQITTARLNLLSQENEFFVRQQGLVEQTVANYLAVVREREEIGVRKADIAIAEETVRVAQRKLEEGLVAEIELSRARTQLAQSEDALVERNRAYRDAMDQLLLVMGLPVGQDTELIDSPPGPQPISARDALVDEALSKRREITVSRTSIEQGELLVDVSEADLKPNLALVGNYSKQGIGVFGSSDRFSSLGYWSAGLDYSLPIGSTRRREQKVNALRNLEQQKVNHEQLLQEIRNEVLASVRALEAAEASLRILLENLKVGEDRLRLAQRMVEEGIVPNRDVLEAQVDLTRTRSGILAAKIQYYLASIRLQRAVGRDISRELAG